MRRRSTSSRTTSLRRRWRSSRSTNSSCVRPPSSSSSNSASRASRMTADFEHRLPGKQLRQVRADHVFEQDERGAVARPDRHEPRQSRRHLDDRRGARRCRRTSAQTQREVQRQRREQRKRTRHVDRERRQHRKERVAEERAERRAAGRHRVVPREQTHAVSRQGRQELRRDSRYSASTSACARCRTAASCCAGVSPRRSGVASPSVDRMLQRRRPEP